MERVELLTRLEEVFQVRVPPEVAQGLYSVRELVEALRPSGPARDAVRPARGDVWSPLLAGRGTPEPALRDLLEPRPLLAPALFVATKIAAGVARLALRLRVRGREHLPAHGPFILSPNHQSYLDVFLLVSLLPFRTFRDLFFVGASEYFDTPFRQRLAQLVNVIPVDPDSNLLRAMQAGAFGLRHGKVLVLFPEGERSIDGAPKGFKKGAAILSAHLRAPIVPVSIDGLFEVWPRGRGLRWQALAPWVGPRARCRFGPPLEPETLPDAGAQPSAFERLYEQATERLRTAVVTMWQAARLPGTASPALDGPEGDA
jgi:1-acyl-sn-glycerol-3-phosphate acyltransferase